MTFAAPNYRFSDLAELNRKLLGFRAANRLNPVRYLAAMRALDMLHMAQLAYGNADRRAYLAKAQCAFRLAFV